MASLIQNTPIIKGEEAKKFREDLKDSFCFSGISEPEKEREGRERMEKNYQLMVSISDGTFS
ncbi:hypothetical protein FACS189464_2270 [Bacteroidia bacterium]|nr:hypothetical protein FACS189464_2270 [Bacteroidia bacterium]